jgi:hypothetical protein
MIKPLLFFLYICFVHLCMFKNMRRCPSILCTCRCTLLKMMGRFYLQETLSDLRAVSWSHRGLILSVKAYSEPRGVGASWGLALRKADPGVKRRAL